MAKAFGGGSSGLYSVEEKREEARRLQASAKAAEEEAALRREWKAECERLRAESAAQREEARLARLRRFGGADGGGQLVQRDLSVWARAALKEKLRGVESEEGDVVVEVPVVLRCEV